MKTGVRTPLMTAGTPMLLAPLARGQASIVCAMLRRTFVSSGRLVDQRSAILDVPNLGLGEKASLCWRHPKRRCFVPDKSLLDNRETQYGLDLKHSTTLWVAVHPASVGTPSHTTARGAW
jgi:hypothetical protein